MSTLLKLEYSPNTAPTTAQKWRTSFLFVLFRLLSFSSITLIFTDISYLIDGENQYQDEQPQLEPHIAPQIYVLFNLQLELI